MPKVRPRPPARRRVAAVAAAALALPLAAQAVPAAADSAAQQRATRIDIDPAVIGEPFGGWGTSLSWFANATGDWPDRERGADLLFNAPDDPDAPGLGLSIVRYNIGGGDDPSAAPLRPGANVPSWRPEADGPYDWEADPRQRWWLDAARERIPEEQFAVDAIAYSAPYWLTRSGRTTGNGDGSLSNLREGAEGEFAAYLADVAQHFAEERGIAFRTLSPVNEPGTDYWRIDGRQEGMHVEPGADQAALLDATGDALAERGLATGLSAIDETGVDMTIDELRDLRDAGFDLDRLEQINVHTYSGGDRETLHQIAKGSADKRLQMSEVTIGTGEHDHESTEAFLSLGTSLALDLRELRPDEWVYWQAIESESESVAGNGNWGLIHFDERTQEFELTRKYHAMRQYSDFIRPGDRFVHTSDDGTVTAYDPEAEELSIVTVNDSAEARTVEFDLGGFERSGRHATVHRTSATEEVAEVGRERLRDDALRMTLPPESITTAVVPVTLPEQPGVANGDFETGGAGQNPVGWSTWGGDAYGSSVEADYTQAGGAQTGHFEAVHYGSDAYAVTTSQRVEVPDGTYDLLADVRSTGGQEVARLFAQVEGGERRTLDIPAGERYRTVALEGIRVRGGVLELGVESVAPGGAWLAFDEVELVPRRR